MGRRRGHPQALGPPGDSRIVDRLNVDRVALEQEFAGGPALSGVADQHGHDMRRIVHHRQAGGAQRVLDGFAMCWWRSRSALDRFRCSTAAAALAATLGGKVEVKMN